MSTLSKAIEIAISAHKGQKDKAGVDVRRFRGLDECNLKRLNKYLKAYHFFN